MIKSKVFFWRAGFSPANQSNLKSFRKALIGWKKAGPPKKPLVFWSCKQAILVLSSARQYSIGREPGPPSPFWLRPFKMRVAIFTTLRTISAFFLKNIYILLAAICALLSLPTCSLFTCSKQKWLFSRQSGLFEKFSDCSDWLDKSRPSKKSTFVLILF